MKKKDETQGRKLPAARRNELLEILRARFEKNPARHRGIRWEAVRTRLETRPNKLWSLDRMEATGGEPDVIGRDAKTGEFLFCDCSEQTPRGRRSLCYDEEARRSRKQHKPEGSATGMAAAMGVELLTEQQYQRLQELGEFDTTTSSWVQTPLDVRRVFIYHNGAESYYSARGFRAVLRV